MQMHWTRKHCDINKLPEIFADKQNQWHGLLTKGITVTAYPTQDIENWSVKFVKKLRDCWKMVYGNIGRHRSRQSAIRCITEYLLISVHAYMHTSEHKINSKQLFWKHANTSITQSVKACDHCIQNTATYGVRHIAWFSICIYRYRHKHVYSYISILLSFTLIHSTATPTFAIKFWQTNFSATSLQFIVQVASFLVLFF